MRPAIVAGVLAALAAIGWVGYRVLLPRAFVAAGRGALNDVQLLQVTNSQVAQSALDFDGKTVEAGPEQKYILVSVRVDAPAGDVDFDDFQLVKAKAPKLGDEENVGNNADRGHFYWSFVDASGNRVSEVASSQRPFTARFAFKVPKSAASAYLFYWGLYWGPLEFGSR